MKMLIADDESVIRKGLLSLDWKRIGIEEVMAAGNGEEAKKILLSDSVDIGLFDIRMPGLSGLELAEMIRECSLDTAVILLTGFSEFEYARQALRSGCAEYLLKPVNPGDLLITVERVKIRLESDRRQRQSAKGHEENGKNFDIVQQVQNQFPKVSDNVRAMLTDMAREFSEPLSLKILSERYYFTGSYVSKKIKQETGYSFISILNAIRLINAAKLLREGEKINLACEESGFRDQRYFSQVFKKVFGCSPSEYKKKEEETHMEIQLCTMLDNMEKDK